MLTILEDDASSEAESTEFVPALCERKRFEVCSVKSRILVIDDDRGFCELLSLYFVAKGFEVVATRSAAEGMELLAQGQFDLAILDWYLDGTDALDLLNLSKGMNPDIPVIIFTGAEQEVFLKKVLKGRADGVVRKMGSLDALSKEVCQHLGWLRREIVE
jgi:DNA-binding response OmpR family regulator